MIKKALSIAFTILLIIYAGALGWPYEFKEVDTFVDARRTPEENANLNEKFCKRDARGDYCPCLMNALYARTSRLERMLEIYDDSWAQRFTVWQGARNFGFTNEDIARKLASFRASLTSAKAQCIDKLPKTKGQPLLFP